MDLESSEDSFIVEKDPTEEDLRYTKLMGLNLKKQVKEVSKQAEKSRKNLIKENRAHKSASNRIESEENLRVVPENKIPVDGKESIQKFLVNQRDMHNPHLGTGRKEDYERDSDFDGIDEGQDEDKFGFNLQQGLLDQKKSSRLGQYTQPFQVCSTSFTAEESGRSKQALSTKENSRILDYNAIGKVVLRSLPLEDTISVTFFDVDFMPSITIRLPDRVLFASLSIKGLCYVTSFSREADSEEEIHFKRFNAGNKRKKAPAEAFEGLGKTSSSNKVESLKLGVLPHGERTQCISLSRSVVSLVTKENEIYRLRVIDANGLEYPAFIIPKAFTLTSTVYCAKGNSDKFGRQNILNFEANPVAKKRETKLIEASVLHASIDLNDEETGVLKVYVFSRISSTPVSVFTSETSLPLSQITFLRYDQHGHLFLNNESDIYLLNRNASFLPLKVASLRDAEEDELEETSVWPIFVRGHKVFYLSLPRANSEDYSVENDQKEKTEPLPGKEYICQTKQLRIESVSGFGPMSEYFSACLLEESSITWASTFSKKEKLDKKQAKANRRLDFSKDKLILEIIAEVLSASERNTQMVLGLAKKLSSSKTLEVAIQLCEKSNYFQLAEDLKTLRANFENKNTEEPEKEADKSNILRTDDLFSKASQFIDDNGNGNAKSMFSANKAEIDENNNLDKLEEAKEEKIDHLLEEPVKKSIKKGFENPFKKYK